MSETETTPEVDAVPDMEVPAVEPEWLTQDILLLPGALPWGDYLIDVAQEPDWDAAVAAEGGCTEHLLINIEKAPCLAHAEKGLIKIIGRVLDVYKEKNQFAHLFTDLGYHLLRYEEGKTYGPGCDQRKGDDPLRLLSVVFFPNDDYQGGEIYFPRHDISFKPKAGDVVVFPSGFAFPYGIKASTGGTRYVVLSWLH